MHQICANNLFQPPKKFQILRRSFYSLLRFQLSLEFYSQIAGKTFLKQIGGGFTNNNSGQQTNFMKTFIKNVKKVMSHTLV